MSICQNCGFNDGKKMSTGAQRRAYFGIAVNTLAEHYSVEKNTMHKALAGAFFGFVDIDFGGGLIMTVPATTTGRTTKEISDFYTYVQKLASERGINIPSPDPKPPED